MMSKFAIKSKFCRWTRRSPARPKHQTKYERANWLCAQWFVPIEKGFLGVQALIFECLAYSDKNRSADSLFHLLLPIPSHCLTDIKRTCNEFKYTQMVRDAFESLYVSMWEMASIWHVSDSCAQHKHTHSHSHECDWILAYVRPVICAVTFRFDRWEDKIINSNCHGSMETVMVFDRTCERIVFQLVVPERI